MRHGATKLLLLLLLLHGASAHAHRVLAQELPRHETRVVQFGYSTGDNAPFAQITVFSPGPTDSEYQNGRTDRLGRFAFAPNQSGEWRIMMRDGMGHAITHTLTVGPLTTTSPPVIRDGAARFATPLRALLGISILINLYAAIGYLARYFERKKQHAHQ